MHCPNAGDRSISISSGRVGSSCSLASTCRDQSTGFCCWYTTNSLYLSRTRPLQLRGYVLGTERLRSNRLFIRDFSPALPWHFGQARGDKPQDTWQTCGLRGSLDDTQQSAYTTQHHQAKGRKSENVGEVVSLMMVLDGAFCVMMDFMGLSKGLSRNSKGLRRNSKGCYKSVNNKRKVRASQISNELLGLVCIYHTTIFR
jgi:hypothetical protein